MPDIGIVIAVAGLVVTLAVAVQMYKHEMVRCVVCGRPGTAGIPGFPCMPHCSKCVTMKGAGVLPRSLDVTKDNQIHRRWLGAVVDLGERGRGLVVVLNDGHPAVAFSCSCQGCGGLAWVYLRPNRCVTITGAEVVEEAALCPKCWRDRRGS
jgi:hypothetical protein